MKIPGLAIFMAIIMTGAAAADLIVIESDVAKVYSAPSLASPVAGQLVKNEICAVAESDWLYVIMPDGRTGWLRARDGRRLGAPPAVVVAGADTVTVAENGLPPAPVIDQALYEEAQRQIIRHLPNYPEARPLTVIDLALFAGVDEQRAARAAGNRYVLRGDFNGNGLAEIAMVGLLAPQPQAGGGYRAFLLVVEERGRVGPARLYFNGAIGLQRGQVENAFLFTGADGGLRLGFANNSGFMAGLLWDGRNYRIDEASAR